MIVLNGSWKEEIEESWKENGIENLFHEDRNDFLAQIWHQSMMAFDTPREIQVVIDDNDDLHISFGSASFVSFDEEPSGLKLPIKCWIHTHPFGQAYFSGTDKKTIDTWKPMMRTAIVLGDNEHQVWFRNSNKVIHYQYKTKREKTYMSLEEEKIREELIDQYQLERVEGYIPSDIEFEDWVNIMEEE